MFLVRWKWTISLLKSGTWAYQKKSAEGELQYRERKQINFDPRHPEEGIQLLNALEQLQTVKAYFPKLVGYTQKNQIIF